MKTIQYIYTFLLFYTFSILSYAQSETTLQKQLSAFPELSDINRLESSVYQEKYEVNIKNPIDWNNPNGKSFKSRIIVCYKGMDRPTVIVTEGYYAHYALLSNYEDELSHLFNTNVIVCEHRFYGKSVPDSINWQYLTIFNALADIHHVRSIFGNIFKEKWISTGISKGGQTTMFYRVMYPDDVDISVSYVAPLNKGVEDGRHELFLTTKVGTEEQRMSLFNAQRELLKRKSRLLPLFQEFITKYDYNYQTKIEDVFDYCIFELPFAFWQWGISFETIPSIDANDNDWFRFMMKVSEPDYFSYPTPTTPFFVQAAYELGYYGYSIDGLTDLCSVTDTHNYLRDLMLPPDAKYIVFNDELYKNTVDYLIQNDPKHIFIYGENDPWSASGVCEWLDCSQKENMRIYVQPNGSHKARIRTMPNAIYKEIMARMTEWLE